MTGLADVEWDVAEETRAFIDSEWATHNVGITKPDVIRLVSEDEHGDPVKGWDPAGLEYVLVNETDTRGFSYSDGPRDVVDPAAVCFVTVTTYESRERREELWQSMMRLAVAARKRSEHTPGNWDTVDVAGNAVPDEFFNYWQFEMEWRYVAHSRTL